MEALNVIESGNVLAQLYYSQYRYDYFIKNYSCSCKEKKNSSFPEIPTCYFHVVLYYVPNVSLKTSEDGVFSVNSFA